MGTGRWGLWLLCAGALACGGADPGDGGMASGASRAVPAAAPSGPCQQVRGTFTDVFLSGEACAPESPILLCTQGQLEGDLTAGYDFFFTTQTATHDHGPAIHFHFNGESHLTFTDGTLFSEDQGEITIKAKGDSPFVTKIEIVSGTGAYEGVTGRLIAIGKADLSTGLGGGTYHGRLCGLPAQGVASASGVSEQVLGATPK